VASRDRSGHREHGGAAADLQEQLRGDGRADEDEQQSDQDDGGAPLPAGGRDPQRPRAPAVVSRRLGQVGGGGAGVHASCPSREVS
jgi:hypothetical protein